MPPFCAMHINILAFRKQQGTVYFHFYPILCVHSRIAWMWCMDLLERCRRIRRILFSTLAFRSRWTPPLKPCACVVAWDFPICKSIVLYTCLHRYFLTRVDETKLNENLKEKKIKKVNFNAKNISNKYRWLEQIREIIIYKPDGSRNENRRGGEKRKEKKKKNAGGG